MPTDARLFPIADIIAVISGVPILQSRSEKVDEIVRHVTGLPSMPPKSSEARQTVVDAVRSQLPSSLSQFGLVQLIETIFDIKSNHDADSVRPELIKLLEGRFGRRLPLCPHQQFFGPSVGVRLLEAIAADCGHRMQLSDD